MWIDLTHPIHSGMVTWPGDPSPEIQPLASIDQGDGCNTSLLTFSSHTGTHMDAPRHFIPQGRTIDELDLDVLVGKATVVDLSSLNRMIEPGDLHPLLPEGVSRLLLKTATGRWMNDPQFMGDFVALSPEGAEYLVKRGIRLVGIDYLSIEPRGLKGHPVHHILLGNGIIVVEGLNLSGLNPGEVDLICLPLKIRGGDGSPCRAIARLN